jgi:hypothetical protein
VFKLASKVWLKAFWFRDEEDIKRRLGALMASNMLSASQLSRKSISSP